MLAKLSIYLTIFILSTTIRFLADILMGTDTGNVGCVTVGGEVLVSLADESVEAVPFGASSGDENAVKSATRSWVDIEKRT